MLGQVTPEVGYWVRPDLMVSLQGRIQLVTGNNEFTADGHDHKRIPAALAAFAKATWFTSTSGNLRPFVSGAVGGGEIRHVVTFSNLTNCGPVGDQNQQCKDSVRAGPLLAQVGGGVSYKLGDSLALLFGVNSQVAAPDFTLNFDINAGIGYGF
jgi:hypothetical protein